MSVAGTILAYEAKPAARQFTCTWTEDAGAENPSRFYVPASFNPSKERIKLEPAGQGFQIEPVAEGCENIYLTVPPTDKGGERRLVIE
jgi:hypothetical protein